MDLRALPSSLNSFDRCNARRRIIELKLGIDLGALAIDPAKLGRAEERNCEQMFGHVPIPIGIAGPIKIIFSSGDEADCCLPLATTEAALVASVNRGCKVLTLAGGVKTKSIYHGMSRSLAFGIRNPESEHCSISKFRIPDSEFRDPKESIRSLYNQWKQIGESTSSHLKIINHHLDESDGYIFLTIDCDTDEAMGMNMVTIASQAIGEWIEDNIEGIEFITVAGNVDSDKKPSRRTHDLGRGYEVIAEVVLPESITKEVLHTTNYKLQTCAEAKLIHGSKVAGALSSNLHAANVIAAVYLATGQDMAHVVEGSLTDTTVRPSTFDNHGLRIAVRCPAILVGVRGGGTELPAQSQCLNLLLKRATSNDVKSRGDHRALREQQTTSIHPCRQLAETIGAAVLAGEISLLAAQATHTLAKSHEKLARGIYNTASQ